MYLLFIYFTTFYSPQRLHNPQWKSFCILRSGITFYTGDVHTESTKKEEHSTCMVFKTRLKIMEVVIQVGGTVVIVVRVKCSHDKQPSNEAASS
jgi:hypothetical protein